MDIIGKENKTSYSMLPPPTYGSSSSTCYFVAACLNAKCQRWNIKYSQGDRAKMHILWQGRSTSVLHWQEVANDLP